ncbi:2-dehydro-3-deoxygalactonokinase, partial [Parapusillimonas sp. SGNA-6]|nr:2-dehydro-3-deoxygalactonokinase [Parapusillimonas sp. SGNA-6]
MKYFFSVDWGTSSLRVRFVGVQDNSIVILHETTNQQGCGYVYEAFKNEKEACSREEYFLQHLRPYLILPPSISMEESIPVVISGMASSSIGMREISYSTLPFALDGNNLRYERIPSTPAFDHDVLLLSGVCSTNDVMRGEEVQLLGLQQHGHSSEALYILPGTHSKHIWVKDNNAIAFKTYITGEMFQVLSTHSLLKNSITKPSSIDQEAFRTGLKLSGGNILHDVFTIRASKLLQNTENSANYSLL